MLSVSIKRIHLQSYDNSSTETNILAKKDEPHGRIYVILHHQRSCALGFSIKRVAHA